MSVGVVRKSLPVCHADKIAPKSGKSSEMDREIAKETIKVPKVSYKLSAWSP